MRKTNLFAFAAAALILAGVAGWVASTPQASVAAPIEVRIDTSQVMMNAKDLPTERFQDFTFVFVD
jgi:Flp pilus assembly protein CpaB